MRPNKNSNDKINIFQYPLDIIASILGILLGIIIISLFYLIGSEQRDIGLTILAASLLYLILRKKIINYNPAEISSKKSTNLLLNILFCLIYTATIIILYTNVYFRPTIYFILISLMAGIVAVDILFYSKEHSVFPIFIKIFALSTNIRAGIWYAFPSFSGSDVYWHSSVCKAITENGYLPPFEIMGKYYFTPLSHIYVSAIQILCHENTKNAIFCFALIISILVVFVYLIGRDISSPRLGLLAALVLCLINSVIQYAFVNFTPSVLCFCYFLGLLYILFKIIAFDQNNIENIILITILSIGIIYTHQLSSFVILISIFSIYIMYSSIKILEGNNNKIELFTCYLILFVTIILSQWIYSFVNNKCSFFEFVLGPFIRDIFSDKSYECTELIRGVASPEPLLTTITSGLPYLLPVFFAIGGVLLWIGSRDNKKLQIVAPIVILYAIIYGFPLIGMRNLLTHRWLPFLSVFLCLVIAAYILSIANVPQSRIAKVSIVLMIITSFCFVMIITPGINKDNPIIMSDKTVRNQFTDTEVTGMDTLTNITVGSIKSDSAYLLLKRSELWTSQIYTSMSLDYIAGIEFSDQPNTLIAIRKCGMTEPFAFNTGKRGISEMRYLPEHFLDRFDHPQYDLIYTNKEVLGYLAK